MIKGIPKHKMSSINLLTIPSSFKDLAQTLDSLIPRPFINACQQAALTFECNCVILTKPGCLPGDMKYMQRSRDCA